ncbi:unnamed protein product [Acanthoscelides obtectus]|uniref:SWIM-type domain-containing protein n=1 Tax=Acanthoscelides obtectus TaxID=200917 RepID=A0A9P0QB94_ACAOB|nr:unnamed protein product [Acanthoscelides obtectus]CAK1688221.1 hypothetical protein AOBTE_LOCUS36620 [Acanthoscelides obtectus]
MEQNFVKADSSNLPKVAYEMIDEYYRHNADFVKANVRNVKTQRSGKQSYGDQAIGFVQLMREGSICTVKCHVTPEHKIHEKGYQVTICINEAEEKITHSVCHSCPAGEGGCKHGVALIFWLLRHSTEPSVTSVECYWRKQILAKLGSSLKAAKLNELFKNIPIVASHNNSFLKKLLEKGLENKSNSIYKTENAIDKVSLYHLIK